MIYAITKKVRRLLFILYLIRKIKWLKLWKLHDRKSSNVLMVVASFPNLKRSFWYCFAGAFENDFALCATLIEMNIPFRLVFGFRKLMDVENSTIYYNLSELYADQPGDDYSEALLKFQEHLLARNNRLVPSHEDSKFWENKIYMHQRFKELEIPHPQTFLIDEQNAPPVAQEVEFPVLLKPAHASGSTGIIKIDDAQSSDETIASNQHKEYMIQQWVDMRRDLRLIYIGDELVLHYWRVNNLEHWRPTSTSHGSSVDFETLPEKWMDFIFQQYKKLDLKTGAFDITWKNDDLSGEPLFLEVSPSYMPNPAPVGKYLNEPYVEFKKSIFGKNAYYKEYVDLIFRLKKKLILDYQNEMTA